MGTKLVLVKEASDLLGIGESTLRRKVKEGNQEGKIIAKKCWIEVDDRLFPNQKRGSDELANLERETQIAQATIKRDEALGSRDKPSILAERAADLDQRQKAIDDYIEWVKGLYKLIKEADVAYANSTEEEQEAVGEELRIAFVALREFVKSLVEGKDSMFAEEGM